MKLSQEELDQLQLKPETIALAVELVKTNGFVIFENVVPKHVIDAVDKNINELLIKEVARKGMDKKTNYKHMFLPFEAPYIDPMIIEHPFTLAIADEILGNNCAFRYLAAGTSMPGGAEPQHVHSDVPHLFGESTSVVTPIATLVVNISVVDFHVGNGPMEIWPGGTHWHYINMFDPKKVALMQEVASHMYSEYVQMPAGSILIRDARMWHRGTPNKSNVPRPCISMLYTRSWNGNGSHIPIPQQTYDALSDRAKKLVRYEKIGAPVSLDLDYR